MSNFEFVDLEVARHAPGLRLVVVADVPSPWSIAARSILQLKGLPVRLVRMGPPDDAVRSWTGVRNAPVLMYEDEPPRSGWFEILAFAERLRPEVSLVPAAARDRASMFGLTHELMSEGGLLWSMRLMTIAASIESEGRVGWPIRVARYLGARYGYSNGCEPAARTRLFQALQLLGEQLASSGGPYYFGDRLTALDVYSAAAMHSLAPLAPEQCPMHPVVRATFEWVHTQVRAELPQSLVAHRDRMYAAHLTLPVQL